ncbi:ABC transporter permease [bacterium]|nr:ABC transporter permease [bacterium]
MIKNYFKTALRKLNRNKSYTLINVLGLSLGITCALMIFLIVRFELTFDDFHSKKDRLYRVNTDRSHPDGILYDFGTQSPLAPALRTDFPDIEKVTVCEFRRSGLITITEDNGAPKKFQENEGIVYIEPEFFDMFDFGWKIGSPGNSLSEPNSVVLAEEIATKYFPGEDPIGHVIRMDNERDLKVTGVIKDFPTNSDFPFKILISYATLRSIGKTGSGFDITSWNNTSSNVNTFVLLHENNSPSELEGRLPQFVNKYFKNDNPAEVRVYHLQPLSTIHYDTRYGNFSDRTTSVSSLLALAIIGVFLIVTACINFINLATAQAVTRSREVGVRKVLGAQRTQLIGQLLGETFIITSLAAIVSIVLTEVFFSFLTEALELKVTFHPFTDSIIPVFLLTVIGFVTLLSGLYPAFVLSRFQPAIALKGKITSHHSGGIYLRKGLVVLQFAITQTLIIGTFIVMMQMQFLQQMDLGFNKEAVVTVPLPTNEKIKLESLRAQLTNTPGIKDFCFGYSGAASGNRWTSNFRYNDGKEIQKHNADIKTADDHFIPTYSLTLLAGRNLSASDTVKEFVVNEATVRKLGMATPQDAIGKVINFWAGMDIPIVGVVKDFNMNSLHENMSPCLITSRRNSYYEASFKIAMNSSHEVMAQIEKAWSNVYPEYVFERHFIDETLHDFYKQEEKASNLFRIFSGIAIFIGSMGLFGLISFIATQRTKEIGVRKVLGAGVSDILMMFGKEFVQLVVIAFVFAAPIAYFTMNGWLEDFAYRIAIGPGVFVMSITFTLAIAALTVGYRAIRAATANPVDALKYE